jgi:phenylpropionate dioxygenase-like ring-hydroxylating dioxygenase large terminal subunit
LLDVGETSVKTSETDVARARVDLRKVGAHPDYWYPVAWSHEIKRGGAFASSFAGEPIAIVRPEQGEIFALEDRCAHRQVPLSKGVVRNCRLHCGYHGWSYDASGRCVDVPYLGKAKLPNGVRSYPCCERDGVVFVWPGSSPATPPPSTLGAAADKAYKTRRFGRAVNCHYTFMHENLMDMHHQFLHRRTTGKVKPQYLGKRSGDRWMELDYSFARSDKKPPLGETLIVGRLHHESASPRDLMTIRTEYPYQTVRFWASTEKPALHVWLGYTPIDALQRKNRMFIVLSVRRPKIPGALELMWPFLTRFTNRVLDEDQEIVEMEQCAYDAQGGDRNQEVFPAIRELRELLSKSGVAG